MGEILNSDDCFLSGEGIKPKNDKFDLEGKIEKILHKYLKCEKCEDKYVCDWEAEPPCKKCKLKNFNANKEIKQLCKDYAESLNNWISVDDIEKLPKSSKRVLVMTNFDPNPLTANLYKTGWCVSGHIEVSESEITHHKPLPKPPQKEK